MISYHQYSLVIMSVLSIFESLLLQVVALGSEWLIHRLLLESLGLLHGWGQVGLVHHASLSGSGATGRGAGHIDLPAPLGWHTVVLDALGLDCLSS